MYIGAIPSLNGDLANTNTAINTLNTGLNNANTAISKKQDASTAITTSNISMQSVNYAVTAGAAGSAGYATSAGSAVDQTARNNADAALAISYTILSVTSTTYMTELGTQVAMRAGRMVNVALAFGVISTISSTGLICVIPVGYRPNWNIGNRLIQVYNSNKAPITKTININTNGGVTCPQGLSVGDIVHINITYPCAS